MDAARIAPALLLALAAVSCGKEPAGRYNVVLISIDSLRPDRLGPYGHRPAFAPDTPVTPNLDRLAATGATFEDCWASTSWTLPSHVSMMTGLDDRAHGVELDAFAIDPLHQTVAEAFQADGYATGAAYSGPYLDPKYGFARGFDEYRSAMTSAEEFAGMVKAEDARRRAAGQPPLTPRAVEQMRDRLSHWDLTSPRVNAFAEDFLDRHGDGRFFLFLHYFDAHYDYLPERGDPQAAERFDPGYRGAFHGENWYFDERVMTWPSRESPWGERRIGERDLEHVLALYDAEIQWVDRHVGAVLDRIARMGLEDETIVIVTSDHGDEFFEHGSIGHRSTLHAELLRVPLIVRVPGAGQRGQRVDALTRIVDLAPSLLDWCGLPPLPHALGASLRGILDGGGADGRQSFHRIYAGFNRDRSGPPNVREAWRDAQWTVIRYLIPDAERSGPQGLAFLEWNDPRSGADYLVYDRTADPKELRPLPAADPRRAQAIEAFRAAWRTHEAACAALPSSPAAARRSAANTADQQAALDALGYANAGAQGEALHPPLLPFPEPRAPR